MALGHAQFLSLPVHLLCKGGIAAGKLHSSCSGSIVAGGQQHAIAESTLGHNIPVYQPHGRTLYMDRIVVHRKGRIQIAAFQTEQRGHDLGRACHRSLLICRLFIEHLTGHRFHQNAGLRRNRQSLALYMQHRQTSHRQTYHPYPAEPPQKMLFSHFRFLRILVKLPQCMRKKRQFILLRRNPFPRFFPAVQSFCRFSCRPS